MKQLKTQQQPSKHIKYKFNIMIDEILPKTFDNELWGVIHSLPPADFLSTQQDIMNILISDQKLFESFFKRFYLNHIQLHNWYMLAKENQLELKKYVLRQLIDKSYKEYREIIKDEEVKKKFIKMNEVFRAEKSKEKKKESFHKMLLGNSKIVRSSNFNSQCDEEKERKKQVEFQNTLQEYSKQDYHELFLKTFNACDGNKYIYYDFDKHMKGIEEQKKYNNFIRIKKHTRMHNSMTMKEQNDPQENVDKQNSEKLNSLSTHMNTQNSYFHEGEESYEKMIYCSYNMNPIGEIKTEPQSRDQYIIKKLPNVFRKVKTTQSTKTFLLRKKKIF